MINRRRAWSLGLLAIILLAIFVGFLFWQFSGSTSRRLAHENYRLVRMGMSQAEVESLLGGPPGNYGRYADGESMMTLEGYIAPPGAVERVWCDDQCRLEIYFDAEDHVVGHHRRAGYSQSPSRGVLGWLRRLVGL